MSICQLYQGLKLYGSSGVEAHECVQDGLL